MKQILTAIAATTLTSNAAIIAHYDANTGSPPDALSVVAPNDNSTPGDNTLWTLNDSSLGSGDAQEGAFEGGQGAWRNLDGTANNNPGYRTTLTTTDYQNMYDNGWSLTIRLRLQQGGQFISVGGDNNNTGTSFNFAGDRRIGASLNASGDDYTVAAVGAGGSTVTVTDGILNQTYVRIEIIGDAGAQTATWNLYNDDTNTLLSSQALTGWASGNGATDDNIGWQSGSSSGDNREAYYREVSLVSVPEPTSSALLGLSGLALILRRRK
ncbi:PEP-CTERM sorting domain-containing protein [Rubritalea tangerina]|uniref:PEP-CTERM sorting domain-containing protein n=1 Tax=Rubritalea tangerina TaxID=430798 RepID=A0ABW4Z7S6_9BACT